MKNLKENEMVIVSGGKVNWDAWEDGYNCVKCRVMCGSSITWALFANVAAAGGALGIIASIVARVVSAEKASEAQQYCTACFQEVFE